MNKTLLISIAAALLVGGGVGYLTGGSKSSPTEPPVTTTSMLHNSTQSSTVDDLKTKSGDSLDEAFLDGMIAHHQQAIDMAAVALQGSMRPEIKQMAQDIINAQTKEIGTMQGWLKAWFGR